MPLMTAERRRAARKEQRRSDLLEAALAVFSRDGYALAKLDDVAEEAGVSKGTIYRYFDSKEHIFEEMIRATMLPVIENLEVRSAGLEGAAADILGHHIRFLYRELLSPQCSQAMHLIISEGSNFPAISKFYYNNILARGMRAMKKILHYGAETGEFRALKGTEAMLNVIGGTLAAGVWMRLFQEHEPIDIEAYTQAHIDLVLSGLLA